METKRLQRLTIIIFVQIVIFLQSYQNVNAQKITIDKWSGGTEFTFTFTNSETQEMANNWYDASEAATKIINTMNNFQGGDVGVDIAIRIAKVKVAWDLTNLSQKYLNENSQISNWAYVLRRTDNLSIPIVVADNIAAVWRKLTGTVTAQIVGFAQKGLETEERIEDAYFSSYNFKITYPNKNQKFWDKRIEGNGAIGNVTVKVFIKNNSDYFQGYAQKDITGRWWLNQTYPTKGAKNIVYAKLYKDGILLAITEPVEIFFDDEQHKVTTKSLEISQPKKSVLVILDNSGSMNDSDKSFGQSKLLSAKTALQSVISEFGESSNNIEWAVMAYNGCGNTPIIQQFTQNINIVQKSVWNAKAAGGTPLASSIQNGADYIWKEARGKEGQMIILSDGGESCSGNPVQAASQVYQSGLSIPTANLGVQNWFLPASVFAQSKIVTGNLIPTTIDVVGFTVNPISNEALLLQEVAKAGGGKYYTASNTVELVNALKRIVGYKTSNWSYIAIFFFVALTFSGVVIGLVLFAKKML